MDKLPKLFTNPKTLIFHLAEIQQNHPEATGDFTLLLSSIQTACKFISSKVRKAGIANLYGQNGTSNITGDVQKKLDVICNEVFINTLKSSRRVLAILSEEEDEPIYIDDNGKYIVSFDPLDGSSNVDANVTIGSIFGIWKAQGENPKENLLFPGNKLIAAGYCVYGSATQLILCIDNSVNGYTLDPSLGEFILSHPNLKVPKQHPIYSINEGNAACWDSTVVKYVNSKKFPEKGKKAYSLRYVGSMVADVHRTILYGGIFMYPADSKSPNGKLRLMYECNPLSYIIENAGGKASTGKMRILDIIPTEAHQRCPIFLGSADDVQEIEDMYKLTN
jgi:fructose-1,6-bisphosphatase I